MESPQAIWHKVEINLSNKGIDDEWDRFLARHPYGRHEQTSRWAAVKALDGWQATRESWRGEDEQIVGGYQLLWKHRRPLGRIGYLSQGPMAHDGDSEQGTAMAKGLVRRAHALKLRALLVQPGLGCDHVEPYLRNAGFLPYCSRRLISSTGIIDLRLDEKELLQRMRRTRRQSINKALKGPLRFREGNREDLPDFFRMMQATCRRQHTNPNPSSLDRIQQVWDLYQPTGWLRLFLVSLEDEPVVAGLAIPFGNSLLWWKMGWTGNHRELAPNDRLFWGVITWAKRHGHTQFDLFSIDPHTRSVPPPPTTAMRPDKSFPSFYKDSYRPDIVHFPRPLLWIRSSIITAGYRVLFAGRNDSPGH